MGSTPIASTSKRNVFASNTDYTAQPVTRFITQFQNEKALALLIRQRGGLFLIFVISQHSIVHYAKKSENLCCIFQLDFHIFLTLFIFI